TGMMRQLGGSFGVAVITTYLSTKNEVHRSDLVANLNVNDLDVQSRVQALQHGFMAKGMSADVALQSAYKALDYTVMKQASVLSYMDAFLGLGVMFLLCIPFVLMVKAKKQAGKVDLSEAMH
ncbi:MAG: MFS transporter, partial [Chitinophagaceae bacterium]